MNTFDQLKAKYLIIPRNYSGVSSEHEGRLPFNLKYVKEHYKGIDGHSWSAFSEKELEIVCQYATRIGKESMIGIYERMKVKYSDADLDLLYFHGGPVTPNTTSIVNSDFIFCGYDFGVFDSTWNVYSIILNEVIFGAYDELRRTSKKLNPFLLFSDMNDIKELQIRREQVMADGGKLEEFDENDDIVSVFSVYVYNPSGQSV